MRKSDLLIRALLIAGKARQIISSSAVAAPVSALPAIAQSAPATWALSWAFCGWLPAWPVSYRDL